MTKKRSKSLFVVFTIILVVCLIACFVNFTYPLSINGNYYTYSNFVSNIRLGEDISNSLKIVYSIETDKSTVNYSELKNSTMYDLKKIIQSEGYKDVSVSEYSLSDVDYITIQIGNILTEEDKNSLIALLGDPQPITFSTDTAKEKIFATGKDIKNVTTTSGQAQDASLAYSVVIEFNDNVKQLVEDSASGTIYINLGSQQLTWTHGIDGGILQMSSTNFASIIDAETFANQIKTGMLDLEIEKTDSATITPSYGIGANILLSIISTVFVLAMFVYLIVKYKHMGWLACFNMLFFVIISLFFLQSIPLVHVNFAGIIAILLCTLLATDSLMMVIESAKKHYQADTKLYIAFKMAFKENLFRILILNALVALIGFVCMFMPSLSIQSFGTVALVMPFVSVFCSLVLMRLFVKMYMALNSLDGKKCNFHKGGKNA